MITKLQKFIDKITRRLEETKMPLYAAQSAFYVIFSVLPFVLLLSVILRFLFPYQVETLIYNLIDALPMENDSLPMDYIESFFNNNIPLLSITVLMVLWPASRGVGAISGGLRVIYGTEKPTSFIKLHGRNILYTIAFLSILTVTLALLVFGNTLLSLLVYQYSALAIFFNFIINARWLLLIVLLPLFFSLMYKYIGNSKMRFRDHLPGALFAGLGWQLFSFGYSLYIRHFGGNSNVYGSVGVIILFMVWVHACIQILFWGAEINVQLRQPRLKG